MMIQLFIKGRLSKANYIDEWQAAVYYANYRKVVEGKNVNWEIYFIRPVKNKVVASYYQQKILFNNWVKKNGKSFKINDSN